MPDSTGQDIEQLARVAAGDQSALSALVQRHQDAVYRFACSMLRDPSAAEDVLQETFLSALRHAGSFRGDGSVGSWLMTIARRHAYRLMRRRVGEPAIMEPLDRLGVAAGWGAAPGDGLAAHLDRQDAVRRALASLSESDREIILLRDVEEFSGLETARILEIPVPAMKSRLHRARLRLAAALRKGGYDGP